MQKNKDHIQLIPTMEDALAENAHPESEDIEAPIDIWPGILLGVAVFVVAIVVVSRIYTFEFFDSGLYNDRSYANAHIVATKPPPRGIIYDRLDKVVAKNKLAFSAILNVKEFIDKHEYREEALGFISEKLGVPREEVLAEVYKIQYSELISPIVIRSGISKENAIQIESLGNPTLFSEEIYERNYLYPEALASVLGYVGLPSDEDLVIKNDIDSKTLIGKSGIESFYDDVLRGSRGIESRIRGPKGDLRSDTSVIEPEIGDSIKLTIDAELQDYFYKVFSAQLRRLGRTSGAGLIIDPRNGEILSMISLPSFNGEIMSSVGYNNEEKKKILSSNSKPLFNRVVSGAYTPGSTIKPLVGVAAISEGIIDPNKTIFSPGYLDVPNPYDPSTPTRFLDWRYQGNVDLSSAIAKSSNVYFYSVGGGTNNLNGLGITKIREWWQIFRLGLKTGIDFPGEIEGFLPSPEWKEKEKGAPWLLGDTYNVSIGQGDLLLTPLQLVQYISAIANGGIIHSPHLLLSRGGVNAHTINVSNYVLEEIKLGMRETVSSPLGTAHLLAGLPFKVAGKTGSAQVASKTRENAFFVGYGPFDNPQITVLVLVEDSREGSLNAVPIAEEVFRWYYENRM